MTVVTPVAVHSPAAIARAKIAVHLALAAVYTPQLIRDSDGLVLCPEMRFWRATEIMALTDKDSPKYTTIVLAVGELADKLQAADQKAKAAVAEYKRLCKAVGQDPADLTPAPCNCDGHKMWTALENTRRAALFLLWPREQTGEKYPALATLVRVGQAGNSDATQYLKSHLHGLVAAQIAYTDACTHLGTNPQWGWVLR